MLGRLFYGEPIVTVLVDADRQRVERIIQLAQDEYEYEFANRLHTELRSLFADHVPDEIPLNLQAPFLQMLLQSKAWPVSDAEPIQYKDVNQTKDQLIELIFRQKNHNDSVNAGLQALCKCTFLGAIFHEVRHHYCGWTPSICTGRLKLLAEKISALMRVTGTEVLQLTDDTRQALQHEHKNNPYFESYLERYPLLALILRPYFIPETDEAVKRLSV